MDQKIDAFIEALILGILSDESLKSLTDEEKKAYREKLKGHFDTLILETLLNRLDEKQVAELHSLGDRPEELEAKLEEYASLVPGLIEDIEDRLKNEFEALKQGLTLSSD